MDNIKTRHNVRALLFDDKDRLVLFKRAKPNQTTYWATPGGHVESADDSLQSALHRELFEELSATITKPRQVFLYSHQRDPNSLMIEHFFLAKLINMDLEAPRVGLEFNDPNQGDYEVVFISPKELELIDLKPPELKTFILDNHQALLAL